MASLSIDTKDKADVIALALFNYKPGFPTLAASKAQQQLLDDITDIHQNWNEMHEDAILVGGHIPKHVPGAYPSLSCCGGDIGLVPLEEENGSY